jgi:hypothetical protein
VWCSERLRAKSGKDEILAQTRWSGKIGYLRRGKWISDENRLIYEESKKVIHNVTKKKIFPYFSFVPYYEK